MLSEITAIVNDQPNRLSEILNVLSAVNIQAFGIEEAPSSKGNKNAHKSKKGKIRFVTDDPNAAKYQLYNHKIKVEECEILGVELEHKPGQLLKVAANLGRNGINIEHGYLTLDMIKGRAIVLLRVNENDIAKAKDILKQANFELRDKIEEPLLALAAPLAEELDFHPKGDSRKIVTIIEIGESSYVEFKATMRWDENTHQVNKDLGKDICISIAAFMNSRGGTLFIGINDDQTIRGVNHDYKTLGKDPNDDSYRKAFSDLISHEESIGLQNCQYIDSYFHKVDEWKRIFVIEVRASPHPVWINRGNDFYIRVGPTDRHLNARQVVEYIKAHWGS